MSRRVAPKVECPVVPSRVPEKKKPVQKTIIMEQPSEVPVEDPFLNKKKLDFSKISYEVIKTLKIDISEEEFNKLKEKITSEN